MVLSILRSLTPNNSKGHIMNKKEIEEIIEHREPFLMLDEVSVEIPGEKGTAKKILTGEEYFFEGHFPDIPVMPGVLIVEAMAQASLIIAGGKDYSFKGVKNVKFRKTIKPEDVLDISVRLKSTTDNVKEYASEVKIGQENAASGSILIKTDK